MVPKQIYSQDIEPSTCDKGHPLETCKEIPAYLINKKVNCGICKKAIHKQLFTENEYMRCNECEFIAHKSCVQRREFIEVPRILKTQSLTMHPGTLSMIEKLSGERQFAIHPSFGSRMIEMIPRHQKRYISNVILVPNNVVGYQFNDNIWLHFNLDGTPFRQVEDDVKEVFKGSRLCSESEIENCTKYIALSKN